MSAYLTVRETAELLNMHFMSVYKLVQTGQLPAMKVGSRWKIDPEQLDAWMARRSGVRRSWLLVGADSTTRSELERQLGAGHTVRAVSFGQLRDALEDKPDIVLLDSGPDRHAALAALAICRAQSPPPLPVLAIETTDCETVRAALEQGPVTLLARGARLGTIAQIETMLPWN